jgi:hypothetical protein
MIDDLALSTVRQHLAITIHNSYIVCLKKLLCQNISGLICHWASLFSSGSYSSLPRIFLLLDLLLGFALLFLLLVD